MPFGQPVIRFFLASSMPLRMASGNFAGLAEAEADVPLPSPTTTRAANLKIRPPLTVLETRLMETTFDHAVHLLAAFLLKPKYLPPFLRISGRPHGRRRPEPSRGRDTR